MDAFDWATAAFLIVGCFFAFTGAVGVVRFPDFYTRLHPAGKSDTLAQALILTALCFQCEDLWTVLKLLLIAGILLVTAPTATHAVTKAAELEGLRPWEGPDQPGGYAISAKGELTPRDILVATITKAKARAEARAAEETDGDEDEPSDPDEEGSSDADE